MHVLLRKHRMVLYGNDLKSLSQPGCCFQTTTFCKNTQGWGNLQMGTKGQVWLWAFGPSALNAGFQSSLMKNKGTIAGPWASSQPHRPLLLPSIPLTYQSCSNPCPGLCRSLSHSPPPGSTRSAAEHSSPREQKQNTIQRVLGQRPIDKSVSREHVMVTVLNAGWVSKSWLHILKLHFASELSWMQQ